jgi:hypothetical protein
MQTHYKIQIREIKLQGILNIWNVNFRIKREWQKMWIHSLRTNNFQRKSINYPPSYFYDPSCVLKRMNKDQIS